MGKYLFDWLEGPCFQSALFPVIDGPFSQFTPFLYYEPWTALCRIMKLCNYHKGKKGNVGAFKFRQDDVVLYYPIFFFIENHVKDIIINH